MYHKTCNNRIELIISQPLVSCSSSDLLRAIVRITYRSNHLGQLISFIYKKKIFAAESVNDRTLSILLLVNASIKLRNKQTSLISASSENELACTSMHIIAL